MHCDACGTLNPDGFRFCGGCGTVLAAASCPSCEAPILGGQRFCGQCGTPVGDGAVRAPARLADERKLATILFADVVGFTAMSERMDPEAVARAVDPAFRRLADVVAAHGGTIDKYMGDSLMAVFGVPSSHDDDAVRAVAAGLAMRDLGGEIAFSIGINTGEVIVTSVPDGGVTVLGDAVNVAARLEKAAGPHEVLVGSLTASLAGDLVEFRERRPVVLKGKREPVEVCEAVALRPRAAVDLGVETRPPLTGRDDELAFLRAQWQRTVRTDRPTIVLVAGDAGTGKTRLLDELIGAVRSDAFVLRTAHPGYGGIGDERALAELITHLGMSGDDEIDRRARTILGQEEPSLRSLDPAALRQEQLWALRRLIELRAAERPMLVIVDDAHRRSDRFLDSAIAALGPLEDVPVMVVVSGRAEGQWLRRFPAATTVRLGPIGDEDACRLVQSLVPDRPLAPEAASTLVARAGGNPLFLRELVAMVRARSGFVPTEDGYRLAGNLALPPGIKAVLAARLDSLPPEQKVALQHVTVLGAGATAAQVAGLGLAEAEHALKAMVSDGVLRDGDGFTVVDPLLGEVAYDALPLTLRGELHRRAAALASADEERARHLVKATKYLPGDDSLKRETTDLLCALGSALLETARQPEGLKMLEYADRLGELEPMLLLRLAQAYWQVGRIDDGRAVVTRVPEASGDPVVDAERVHVLGNLLMRGPTGGLDQFDEAYRRWSALGNVEKQAWARSNRGASLFFRGRMQEAEQALREGMHLFEAAGVRDGVVATYGLLALIRPTDPEVPEWLQEVLRYAEEAGDRSRQISSLIPLTWHYYFRQRWGGPVETAKVRYLAERLAAVSREIGSFQSGVYGQALGSSVARTSGDFATAARLAGEAAAVDLSEEPALRALVLATVFVDRLVAEETLAPPVLEPSPDPVTAISHVLVAEALVLAGRPEEALIQYSSALPPALSGVEHVLQGGGHGLAYLLLGDPERALGQTERGLRALGTLDAVPARASLQAVRAEAMIQLGRTEEATDLVASLPYDVGGLAGALVLRARAVLGEPGAAEDLAVAADTLRAPALELQS